MLVDRSLLNRAPFRHAGSVAQAPAGLIPRPRVAARAQPDKPVPPPAPEAALLEKAFEKRMTAADEAVARGWVYQPERAAPPAPRRPTDLEVVGLFEEWNAALATGDPYEVADLYAPGAVLLPTVSNQYRRTRSEIVDYFAGFLTLQPQGVLEEYEVRHLADGVVANMGVHTFAFGDGRSVKVRFSFTYVRQADGQWLIAEHHSSAMPEDLRAEVLAAFERWNAALQSGNPEAVADCYAPHAVLLPATSDQPRHGRASIGDYYRADLLPRRPRCALEQAHIRFPAPNFAVSSGTYAMRLQAPEAEVRARYTLVYRKVAGEWLIDEHHASAMPEPGK